MLLSRDLTRTSLNQKDSPQRRRERRGKEIWQTNISYDFSAISATSAASALKFRSQGQSA
ncbi:hypothetical protein SBDP1_490036 [Syntrophobacter sp. SbD1]|nr:hypothetical protein SBDP1_490036 [Syntrophobacter sp. SbD1]